MHLRHSPQLRSSSRYRKSLSASLSRSSYQYSSQGFTLLELIIAIAIFAIIGLSSFSLLDTVQRSDERSKQKSERQNELQRAFLLMERDFSQIARRTIRLNGEAPLKGYLHTRTDSFSTEDQAIAFVRHGWTNPGLLLPRSDVQSVAYRLKEGTLERLHYNFVDAVVGEEPKARPLMTRVNSLSFEYFSGKEWLKEWETQTLPLAIAINIETEDLGTIRRLFLVAADRPSNNNARAGN